MTALKKTLTEEIEKRWELKGNFETSIYIQDSVLDPLFKSLSFLEVEKRDEAYTTVSDLAESLAPAEEPAQRDHSSGDESEPGPAPKKKREKQEEISILMATDEEQQREEQSIEMK